MKVLVYSTPTCPYCKMAKEFLTEHNIEFSDVDVSADQQAAEAMVEKSGQMGVPVIIITQDDDSEEVMLGFDEEKLAQSLGVTK